MLISAMVISVITGAVPGAVTEVHADETITVTYNNYEDGKTIDKEGVTCTEEYDEVKKCLITGYFNSANGSFTKIVVRAAYLLNIGERYGWTISGSTAIWEGDQQDVRFDYIGGDPGPIEIEFTVHIPDEYTVRLSGGGNSTPSGNITQNIAVGSPMENVTFTAKNDFHFDEFEPIKTKGITVSRSSNTEITVSGTPTNSVSITIPYAVKNVYPVTGISVSPTMQEKNPGEVFLIEAALFPSYATNKKIKWYVDKQGVSLYSDPDCSDPIALEEATLIRTVYGKASTDSIVVTAYSDEDASKYATCTVSPGSKPEITHTVTFDPNNGADTFTVGVNDGEKITDIPSTDSYTNEGWTIYHKEYNNGWHQSPFNPGDGTFDFANASIESSITLMLVWESSFSVSAEDPTMGKVGFAKKGTDPEADASSAVFTILKDYDDEYNFIAEPFDDYRFVKWVDKDGKTISEEQSLTNYKCAAGESLKAVFERKALNVALGVTDRGEVLVTNEYPQTIKGPGAGNFSTRYDYMTLTVAPAEGSDFVGWYEGTVNTQTGYVHGNTGKLVSKDPEVKIDRDSENKAVQAVFERKALDVELGVTDGGEVLVTSEYPQTIKGPGAGNFSTKLDDMTLTAAPAEGSYFVGWYEGTVNTETGYVDGNTGKLVSKDPEIKIDRDSENKAVQAVFEKIPYKCAEGEGRSWEKGSSSGLIFTFEATGSKDPFDHKNGVEVDGIEISKGYYDERKGSLIIEVKPGYLETLSAGQHQLRAKFTDYEPGIAVNFAISEASGGKDSDKDSDKSDPSPKPVYRLPITGVE